MPLTQRGGWPYGHPPNTQFTLNTQSPQARGLVAWWPTVGGRGSSQQRDWSGRGNDFVWANQATPAANPDIGPLYNYNGINDYADTGVIPPTGSSVRSVSFWIRCETAGNRKILGYGTATNGRAFDWSIEDVGGVKYVLFRHQGGNIRYSGVTLNTTHLITAVVPVGAATTDDVLCYVDGIYRAGARNLGVNQVLNTASNSLYVGRSWSSAAYFDGDIGEIRIYNRALPAAEVWAMYNPATRWELYAPTIPSTMAYIAAAAGGMPWHLFFQEVV